MERRLTAILAADVKGYSTLTELNEEGSTATLRSYRAVAEEAISAHRGRIFSSAGDGMVAEFPSVVEALRCAVEIQNEIAERNATLPENEQMQFRIGVNLGDVISEGDDLYGTGVNVAARLEQMAKAGGICISQTVYDQVRKIIEIPFEDIGERRLKNITEPIHVYRVLPEPLPWFKKTFSSTTIRRHANVAGVLALLLIAVGASSFFLREPDSFWTSLGLGRQVSEHPTVAVLPFRDTSATKDQQHLADGITDELVTSLARFPGLDVTARTSALKYDNNPADIWQVREDLNVRYIVAGNVQKTNMGVRVIAELIDASTGKVIWSRPFNRPVEDVLTTRDAVKKSIAAALGGLQGEIGRAEVDRLSEKDPEDFTAYDSVMMGLHELYQYEEANNKAARKYFEDAKMKDPDYARSYVGLAWTYETAYDFQWTEDFDGALKAARENARMAMKKDPHDYQARWALGWAYLYSWEHARAAKEYDRAREMNPDDVELLAEMGNLLTYIGEPKQAVEQLEEAIELNEKHEEWYFEYLGWAQEHADMPNEAIKTLEKVIAKPRTSDQLWLLPTLAAAYARAGRKNDALTVCHEILDLNKEFAIEEDVTLWPYKTDEQVERYKDGLAKAGLPLKKLPLDKRGEVDAEKQCQSALAD